ncbi:MAG: hypothetical protein UFG06_05295 [Lachnospiraceae bacterium]|nr:hypothetical protein [Lachnospiraceae bacterium]
MKRKKLSYYVERFYPYFIAGIVCLLAYIKKIHVIDDTNFDSLIDGIITMGSIVIGLIGAIIPVILSMKNESKFVKYVFENDKDGLFRKYFTSSIGIGLLCMAFSLSLYVRDEFNDMVLDIVYYVWFFLIILFLLLTYRSMKYMIIVIFKPDVSQSDAYMPPVTKEEILRNRDKYEMKS